MAMISIRGLTKRYGAFVALSNLDLAIEAGDLCGFIGPNGAGKTTTIRILATLLQPTSGVAYIDDVDVLRDPYAIKRIVGYMPDNFGVYEGMRLREYLDFFGAAYKIPLKKRKAIIDDVLTLTDLTGRADDFVSTFSRGMQQRCCLAKTLIHDPKVLLLDEPASGLDPRARIEIKELLRTLKGMGKTILISSHILSELAEMCDKVAIIEHGKLIAAGPIRDIMRSSRQARLIEMEVADGGDIAEALLKEAPGILRVERSGGDFEIETDLPYERLPDLLGALVRGGVRVLFFREQEGTLEDVFMQVTKGGI
jgi:ABC-2 type transport system ATP-binding protein